MMPRIPRPMSGTPKPPKKKIAVTGSPAPKTGSRRAVSYTSSSAGSVKAAAPVTKPRRTPMAKRDYSTRVRPFLGRAVDADRVVKALPDAGLRRLWSGKVKPGQLRGKKDNSRSGGGLIRIDRDSPRIGSRKTWRGSREANPSTVLLQRTTGRTGRTDIDRGGAWKDQLARMAKDPNPAVAARAQSQQRLWRAGVARREAVRTGQAPSRVPVGPKRRARQEGRFSL